MSSISSSTSSKVSADLSKYLSNAKTDSKKLLSSIKSLYNAENDEEAAKATENFVKYYNKIISDNSDYSDSGLKQLTKDLKSIIKDKSESLSSWGITMSDNGKLKMDDSTFETTSADYDFTSFISNNSESGGLFYDINKIIKKLKKDNTYYLSDTSKQTIKNSSLDTYA